MKEEKGMIDKDLIAKARKAQNVDELRKIASENGYELSVDEARGYFNSLNGDVSLTDDELDSVCGAGCDSLKGQSVVTVPERKRRR